MVPVFTEAAKIISSSLLLDSLDVDETELVRTGLMADGRSLELDDLVRLRRPPPPPTSRRVVRRLFEDGRTMIFGLRLCYRVVG